MRCRYRRVCWLIAVVLVLLCGGGRVGGATCSALGDLGGQGAYGLADVAGQTIESCRGEQLLVPASVLKIATTQAALALLGPGHRFTTEFYTDGQGNLFIKGFGDPTLVTEEVAALVQQLRSLGIQRVQTLFVDSTAFALTAPVPGGEDSDNPYDAPVGPLSVNFNSVPLRKDAAGRIVAGEPLTPTLPIMMELGQGRPPGLNRLNLCAQGCDPDRRIGQYAGELFSALLRQAGIPVVALGGLRPVPAAGVRLVYRHRSRQTLEEISRSLLHYSSNFMANLVFLSCGAHQYGYPATWDKARQAVGGELVRQLGSATAAEIVQVDGAGLSRQNRVTVRAMLQLLTRFRPHGGLLKQEGGTAIKTGTLTGIANAAGYLPDGKAFVILLSQSGNDRTAVLERLKQRYSPVRP